MNKIPIFLHIPKSGGTYVLTWAMSMFRFWTNKNESQDKRRLISVKYNDLIILTVLACVDNDIDFIINPIDECNHIINLDDFLIKLSKMDIFFIMIEPDGFFVMKTQVIKSICDTVEKSFIYYMTMRDSFSRCRSLYNYLNSENSNHEKLHGSIASNTFENYLHSNELEDSWLIRSIINISKDQAINNDNFDEVCNILNEVNIVDIENIDSLIDDMFNECHLITRQDVLPHQIILNKNETNVLKIEFSELDNETQSAFLKRTEFDRKLYNKYCK